MKLLIVNGVTHRSTMYKPSELVKDARHAVKGLGKLTDYWIHVQDGGPTGATVWLVATYQQKNGLFAQTNVAI